MLESTPYAKEIADLPLGLIAGNPYSQTAVQLGVGDLVVLYTDGITESTDPTNNQMDKEGLLALARNLTSTSPVEVGEALLAGVEAYRGADPASDDETLIVLQRSPSTSNEAWPR
jgi:sigma-B regulation protein RsbU (phosphoserine phosphatase)